MVPVLRNALAMGADRAIHLTTDTVSADSLSIARALSGPLKELNADIVWCGRQAVDDDACQVGPMLAELLERPCVTVVAHFELDGSKAKVEREIEGGREVIEVSLPALLTTDKGLNEPRYASLKGIMAAKKKPVETKPAELGEPNLELISLSLPPERPAGRIIGEGADAAGELVRVLREEEKVI